MATHMKWCVNNMQCVVQNTSNAALKACPSRTLEAQNSAMLESSKCRPMLQQPNQKNSEISANPTVPNFLKIKAQSTSSGI